MLLQLFVSTFKIILVALIVTIPILWIYIRYISHTYWTRRHKIRQIKPSGILGNYGDVIWKQRDIADRVKQLYEEAKEDYVGTYFFTHPILIVRNPIIIGEILNDNTKFQSSIFEEYFEEEVTPKLTMQRRNEILEKISNYLTPNTLASLHETLQKTVDNLLVWIKDETESNTNKIEVSDILFRYNLDVISNLAFGTETHSIFNPKVTFRKMTDKLIQSYQKRKLLSYSPLADIWRVNDRLEVERYFYSLVRLEINYREDNRLERTDLLQLMLQLRNGNKFRDGRWKLFVQDKESAKEVTLMEMTMILKDMLRTSLVQITSVLTHCLMELAKHPGVQKQVYDEVTKTFCNKKDRDHLEYQEIEQMELLGLFVKETLRLHPCQAFVERRTSCKWSLPGQTSSLPQGSLIFVPINGIHSDKQYFENPEKFIVERMKIKQPEPYTFLPYGKGLCFFDKLIDMSLKTVLCEILSQYEIKVSGTGTFEEKSSVILEFNKRN